MALSAEHRNLEVLLRDAAKDRGAIVKEVSPGHFQIRGQLLVNYYPFSAKRTVYIDGTKTGHKHVSPSSAVDMAFTAPPLASADRRDSRSRSGKYQRWKRRQWMKGNRNCHYCGLPTVRTIGHPDQMTVDHHVPLARGGLDNANNFVVAHARCNQERGHDMPELKQSSATTTKEITCES